MAWAAQGGVLRKLLYMCPQLQKASQAKAGVLGWSLGAARPVKRHSELADKGPFDEQVSVMASRGSPAPQILPSQDRTTPPIQNEMQGILEQSSQLTGILHDIVSR